MKRCREIGRKHYFWPKFDLLTLFPQKQEFSVAYHIHCRRLLSSVQHHAKNLKNQMQRSGEICEKSNFWAKFDLLTLFPWKQEFLVTYHIHCRKSLISVQHHAKIQKSQMQRSGEICKKPDFRAKFDLLTLFPWKQEFAVTYHIHCRRPLICVQHHAKNQKNLMQRSGEICKKPDFWAKFDLLTLFPWKQEFLVTYHIHCRRPLISVQLHAKNQKNLMKRFREICEKPDVWAKFDLLTLFPWKQEFSVTYHIHCRRPLISVQLHAKNQKNLMKRFGEICENPDFRSNFDLSVPFLRQQEFSKKIRLCHVPLFMVL